MHLKQFIYFESSLELYNHALFPNFTMFFLHSSLNICTRYSDLTRVCIKLNFSNWVVRGLVTRNTLRS